jgi:flagellar hook-associated protein 1
MSDFAALNTALSGLISHRRASEQIGHNIANVNTEGYSRTRLELQSAGGGPMPAIFARPRTQGDGVQVSSLIRIRDEFLERRALAEHGSSAELARTNELLNRVELSFPEPGDNGLAAQLSEFWAGFDDVANNPGALGTRTQLLERATTVVQALNRGAADLTALRDAAVGQLDVMVSELNGHTARIAELNEAIQNAVNAELPANDLQDQRDLLIERVSQLTGATTRDAGNGMVDVLIGGTPLVSGIRPTSLPSPTQTPNPTGDAVLDAVGWAAVSIVPNGYPLSFNGGEMAGLLDGVNRLLPSYLQQLNSVASTLATDVNAIHSTGWGLNDAAVTSPARNFFAFNAGLGSAAGIRLTNSTDTPPGVAGAPANVAVANGPSLLDGSLAQQLANLHDSSTGADAIYRSMVANLAVESQTIQRRVDIQDEITKQVDAQRKGVSGVNLDEEMVNLTMTQHAYGASARLMNTITEMIDTIINLGR